MYIYIYIYGLIHLLVTLKTKREHTIGRVNSISSIDLICSNCTMFNIMVVLIC